MSRISARNNTQSPDVNRYSLAHQILRVDMWTSNWIPHAAARAVFAFFLGFAGRGTTAISLCVSGFRLYVRPLPTWRTTWPLLKKVGDVSKHYVVSGFARGSVAVVA